MNRPPFFNGGPVVRACKVAWLAAVLAPVTLLLGSEYGAVDAVAQRIGDEREDRVAHDTCHHGKAGVVAPAGNGYVDSEVHGSEVQRDAQDESEKHAYSSFGVSMPASIFACSCCSCLSHQLSCSTGAVVADLATSLGITMLPDSNCGVRGPNLMATEHIYYSKK